MDCLNIPVTDQISVASISFLLQWSNRMIFDIQLCWVLLITNVISCSFCSLVLWLGSVHLQKLYNVNFNPFLFWLLAIMKTISCWIQLRSMLLSVVEWRKFVLISNQRFLLLFTVKVFRVWILSYFWQFRSLNQAGYS